MSQAGQDFFPSFFFKNKTVFSTEKCSIFNKALSNCRNSRRDTWDVASQAKVPLPPNSLSLLPPIGAAPLCINNRILTGAGSWIGVSRTQYGHSTPSDKSMILFLTLEVTERIFTAISTR